MAQFAADIRGYISKGKIKPARKTFEKAQKAGHKGPQLKEIELELALVESGGATAAAALQMLAQAAPTRVGSAVKRVETHLRQAKDDHDLRDALWEICLEHDQVQAAVKHAAALVQSGTVDGNTRTKQLLGRKDAVGATGIFLMASLGAIKTDRKKLADRLLNNQEGARLLEGVSQVLNDAGQDDAEVHYVLAQTAKRRGDKEAFMLHAGKAFDDDPAAVWTATMADQSSADRLDFALSKDSLDYLLQTAKEAEPKEIVAAAQKSRAEGTTGRTLRAMALVLTKKAQNACRVLEGLAQEQAAASAPVADFFTAKSKEWPGAREVAAAVVITGLSGDKARVDASASALLEVPASARGDAWGRVAPRLLALRPDNLDLRREVGLYLLKAGESSAAVDLLKDNEHLAVAQAWAEQDAADGPVLLRAAAIAEEHDVVGDHAEWLLKAARSDAEVLSELGARLSGSAVSADTALTSARALIDQQQKKQAAEVLARLPLDKETGEAAEALLKEKHLLDDRAFQTVSFRCALALGDKNRARRLFSKVDANVQALAEEAGRHAAAGAVLADVLIGQRKGEIGVLLLDRRRDAGDDARSLLPLADALVKSAPDLTMGRLVRARLLLALERPGDAVRDLRAIPASAPQVDEAFSLLGEIAATGGAATADAMLGRADIDIGRKSFVEAVDELLKTPADATSRLQRFETICLEKNDIDAAHRGRAIALAELDRLPEAADAHMKRFACPDSDPTAVATDLEEAARKCLDAGDIQTGCSVLEQLPNHVSDGAERAIGVIGNDQRAPLLILRSKLLLALGRTEEAVETLSALVNADKDSRPQAAQALESIVESGQARPEADLALADAFEQMGNTASALSALKKLYSDDITGKDKVAAAATQLVVRHDDPDVRLFLGKVCLDMRDPRGATEHAIHARRLRPAARRDCVTLLQRALDQDAFAAETHFALAEAHLAGDEADDAVRHFRAAVEVERNRAPAAIAAMEEAAPRSKRPALLWLAVGTTYAEFQKDHAKAVVAFTHGLDANPTAEMMVPLLLGRGDSYAALKEDDKAFDDFDEASQHDLLERRYYEFLRSRHRQHVLKAAKAAQAEAGTSFAKAADAVGRFIQLGQHDDAIHTAQQALAAATDEIGPRYLVGVALHAAGRYDGAVQVLETVRHAAGPYLAIGRAARILLAESYLDSGDRVQARACLTEIEAVDSLYPGLKTRRAALAPPADDPHAPPPLLVRPEFPRPTE
jgi:tetratricopeptide (TPR) repeat protein